MGCIYAVLISELQILNTLVLLVLYVHLQEIAQIAMNAERIKCEPDRSKAPKEERANVIPVNHSQLNSAKRGVGLVI